MKIFWWSIRQRKYFWAVQTYKELVINCQKCFWSQPFVNNHKIHIRNPKLDMDLEVGGSDIDARICSRSIESFCQNSFPRPNASKMGTIALDSNKTLHWYFTGIIQQIHAVLVTTLRSMFLYFWSTFRWGVLMLEATTWRKEQLFTSSSTQCCKVPFFNKRYEFYIQYASINFQPSPENSTECSYPFHSEHYHENLETHFLVHSQNISSC